MICIECAYQNIDRLYFKYKSEYIKLTICPQCGKIADKYIEYDKVILFIDILLLKASAYRHLAYNVTENKLSLQNSVGWLKDSVTRFGNLFRLIVLVILFEVYLTWAHEEKESTHSVAIEYILSQQVQYQYIYFLARSVVEQVVLNLTIQTLFTIFLGWGKNKNKNLPEKYQKHYNVSVLLLTVLVSSSIKLFPILMLIWPYDKTAISGPIISIIGFLNMIDALRSVTNSSYISVAILLSISTIFKVAASRFVSALLVTYFSGIDVHTILDNEYMDVIRSINSYKDLWLNLRDSILA